MAAGPSISVSLIEPVVRTLKGDLGLEPGSLPTLGPDVDALDDPEGRVSSSVLSDLLNFGVERLSEPTFPVRAGLNVRPGQYGLFEWLIRTSDNAENMVPRLERNFDLIGDLEAPRFEVRDEFALVIHRPQSQAPPPRLIDYILASWLAVARFISGPDVNARQVWFARPACDHAKALEDAFGCDVRFERDVNALAFAADAFERSIGPTDPVVARVVDQRAEEVVRSIRAAGAVTRIVEREVLTRLSAGSATLDAVAQALKMSPRTLRRRLETEGTSFKELRDNVRLREARRRLTATEVPISEIAFDLGYSDPAAFHRAFKRWTGETPAQVRGAMRATDDAREDGQQGQ